MGRTKGSHNKHKKEKPVKEKKKRGRPTKQTQHQKQHQVVNVTINSDGGGGTDKKKKNQTIQSIPNMIFNPSLSIPQGYPITRPETNQPLYDMNSLMQSIQQAIPQTNPRIPQPTPPQPAPPIRPIDVQPIQPNPTPPTPTRPPTQPTHPPEAEPYYPNPQTDQSHPDITIDSNISTSIHNKHMQHQKNLQNIIQPQIPKDTEGLGMKIPISNIVNLATSIGLGAVTGGASVAAEAGIAGAVEGFAANGLRGIAGSAARGVVSSVPIMTRAGIAGGVASGVSHVLGGGQVGNIVAGIAGGLASRGSGGIVGGAVAGAMNNVSNRVSGTRTRTRGRPQNNSETHPLLPNRTTFEGRGNRTGGNRTVSRLVDAESEIQLVNDPSTGGQSTNVMSNIRNIANRTMTSTSETISNLRNQINSRVRGRGRGNYTSLPNSESPYDIQEEHPVSVERVQQMLRVHRAKVNENEKKQMVDNIVNDLVDNAVQQSNKKVDSVSTLQGAIKRAMPGPKLIKEHYKKVDSVAKLQGAARGAVQRKKDRVTTNIDNLTEQLNSTAQYGNRQAVLDDYAAKRQNISNLGKLAAKTNAANRKIERNVIASEFVQKQRVRNNIAKLSKGATDDLKDRWKQSIQQQQTSISNFGQLTQGLKQQQHQQRMGAASMQPMQLQTGTRSGAAFTATEAQLMAPSRMELHRQRNPELTQLRGKVSDYKRGKLQLSDIEKSGIETRIEQLVQINKTLKAKGQGPKVGRPPGSKK